VLWHEEDDVRVVGQKICPIMSGPRGMVLCQGKHCAAACPRTMPVRPTGSVRSSRNARTEQDAGMTSAFTPGGKDHEDTSPVSSYKPLVHSCSEGVDHEDTIYAE